MKIVTKPSPHCPDCGGRMRLREPKNGQSWNAFWGCTNFPDCRGKRGIGPDGKPEQDENLDNITEW
jgi:ssDNA-binding Zn-finger/Zn-ribbon topoisomerase 1